MRPAMVCINIFAAVIPAFCRRPSARTDHAFPRTGLQKATSASVQRETLCHFTTVSFASDAAIISCFLQVAQNPARCLSEAQHPARALQAAQNPARFLQAARRPARPCPPRTWRRTASSASGLRRRTRRWPATPWRTRSGPRRRWLVSEALCCRRTVNIRCHSHCWQHCHGCAPGPGATGVCASR